VRHVALKTRPVMALLPLIFIATGGITIYFVVLPELDWSATQKPPELEVMLVRPVLRAWLKRNASRQENPLQSTQANLVEANKIYGCKTESTFPPAGTFKKSATEVAEIMARKKVSQGGLGSAIRMVQMFINRGGRNLSHSRKKQLEKAKHLLQEKARQEHSSDSTG